MYNCVDMYIHVLYNDIQRSLWVHPITFFTPVSGWNKETSKRFVTNNYTGGGI